MHGLVPQLRVARIRHLCRFLKFAPFSLKWLVVHEWRSVPGHSWLGQVIGDLQWLRDRASLGLPDPNEGLLAWHDFLFSKHTVKRCCNIALVADLNVQCSPCQQPNDESAEIVSHPCKLCPRVLGSAAALGAHMCSQHGEKNELRRYVWGSTCPICLMHFHTRPRLLHHLKCRSKLCPVLLVSHYPPMPIDETSALDAVDGEDIRVLRSLGHPPTFAAVPAFRAAGPLKNWVSLG